MRRGAGYAETFEDVARGHRLREGESPEEYALYMFMHPYRAGLAATTETWPGWWSPDASVFNFSTLLGPAGNPPMEWGKWPDDKFAGLNHGE